MCAKHYTRWLKHRDPLISHGTMHLTVQERFDRLTEKRGPDDCWTWQGSRLWSNYGQFRLDRKTQLAHRVAWLLHHGTWPTSVLDHTCHNSDATCEGGVACEHRRCVNPLHLEDVTQAVNLMRSSKTGQGAQCRQGHYFTEENTYVTPSGKRQCRACSRARRS